MKALIMHMNSSTLLPNLFRSEYRNIVSVLSYSFGIRHVEVAEDIVSDTFLAATETWSMSGVPDNPRAWLYAVARNKIRNLLKRDKLFETTIVPSLSAGIISTEEFELDLSTKNIADSQLAMIFAVCNPLNSSEAQIALALNLLCGFSVQEIADAFFTNKEVIYKRINRARDRLKESNVEIRQPAPGEISNRLPNVLMTLYLLFSEGYYSMSQNTTLRRDFCDEAMRLNMLLMDNALTDTPATKALYALMCFHASRFDSRQNEHGDMILYDDQDASRWDMSLVTRGSYFLNFASVGEEVSRFHLEAGIAYWHTHKDAPEKWEKILELYNHLLVLEYSPVAALNRTFALSRIRGKEAAIVEAEKLGLSDNPHYYSLLGHLYTDIDNAKAREYFGKALSMVTSPGNQTIMKRNIEKLKT